MPKQHKGQYHSSTVPSTALKQYGEQYHSSTMHINLGKPSSTTHTVQNTAQSITSFRTTTPTTARTGRTTTKQVNPVHVHPETSKLQGMTVFTIVDFKKGYWMVVLHPDSRKLTCMALPFGRFQWTQLPMGTVVAQNIFQSKLNAIFIGMEGVTGIADDMVIAGRDEMEHDRNFLAFMEKCMENNLTLNSEKIQFK